MQITRGIPGELAGPADPTIIPGGINNFGANANRANARNAPRQSPRVIGRAQFMGPLNLTSGAGSMGGGAALRIYGDGVDGAPLMMHLDDDHHGTQMSPASAVHTITSIPRGEAMPPARG